MTNSINFSTMKILIYLSVFMCSFFIHAQQSDLLQTIEKEIANMEGFIDFTNTRIQLSAGQSEPFDENDSYTFEEFSLMENGVDADQLRQFFQEGEVSYFITTPYTLFSVDVDTYKLSEMLGKKSSFFMYNPTMMPVFKPVSAVFTDGTEMKLQDAVSRKDIENKYTVTEKDGDEEYTYPDLEKATEIEQFVVENSDSFEYTYLINNTKPVASVKMDVTYPVFNSDKFILKKKGDSFKTTHGKVELLDISGEEVHLMLPSVLEEEMELYALYKNGKILKERSSDSHTYFTENEKKDHVKFLEQLKEAKKLISKGKITTEEELGDYLLKHTPSSLMSSTPEKMILKTIKFSGPVDHLVFMIPGSSTETQKMTLEYDFSNDEEEEDYIIASDFESEKFGILGKNGEWLIKPEMDEYFRFINRYYFTDQIDDRENIYQFNPKTKTLKKVNYRLFDIHFKSGNTVIIENGRNGMKGLARAETGEIILPMEYDHIREVDGMWLASQNDFYGVLNENLENFIPFQFEYLTYEGGYFHGQETREENEMVYSRSGVNITKGVYDDVERIFNSGRLLVKNYKKEDYTIIETKSYFLDENGRVAIDLQEKGWEDPQPFRNGLASVKDKRTQYYGYIDPQGKVVIPFTLLRVYAGFYTSSGLAPVRIKDGTYALIDKEGKVQKTFTEGFHIVSHDESEENVLKVQEQWYNTFGEPVTMK